MPETKGRTLEQIEADMDSGLKPAVSQPEALGGVDTYRIHKMMAARVTTAR